MELFSKYLLVLVFSLTSIFSNGQEKITVQYFLHTTCPISQKYTYVINQIAEKYANKPIQFELIFLDIKSIQQKKAVSDFVKKYQLKPSYKTFTNTTIASKLGVKVTPEVVVIKEGAIIYQGSIDDWFVSWGKNKKIAEQHYLIDAMDAALNNQIIWIKKTNAIGCLIETNRSKSD